MYADLLGYLEAFVVNIRVGALTMRQIPIVAKPISTIVSLLRAFPVYFLLYSEPEPFLKGALRKMISTDSIS